PTAITGQNTSPSRHPEHAAATTCGARRCGTDVSGAQGSLFQRSVVRPGVANEPTRTIGEVRLIDIPGIPSLYSSRSCQCWAPTGAMYSVRDTGAAKSYVLLMSAPASGCHRNRL